MSVSAVEAARTPRRWLVWGLWLALSAAMLAAVGRLPWPDILQRLSQVRFPWVAAGVVANFLILPLWAAEWRFLVPVAFRVGYGRMFGIVTITASVLNAVPFFAGEASAVGLLIARGGLSRSAAVSVLALDQLLVGLAKLLTLAVATFFIALPGWLRAGVLSLFVAIVMLLVTLVVLAHSWEALKSRLERRAGPVRARIGSLVSWGRHLDAIRDIRRAAPAIMLAVLKKAAEVVAILATQLAFGMDPSVPAAVLVAASLAVTTLLPISPANLGVYEATVFAAYRYLGVPAETAVGLAVVQHASFLLPSVVTGYAVATLAQLRTRGRATLRS